jgi:NitT/TauT family transport system substrate-binding protein
MNEINKLIWPSPDGIGITNADAWQRSIDIALNTPNLEGATVLTEEPSEGAYTNDIVTAAHALLPADLDITGEGFEPIPVEDIQLEEGGA